MNNNIMNPIKIPSLDSINLKKGKVGQCDAIHKRNSLVLSKKLRTIDGLKLKSLKENFKGRRNKQQYFKSQKH